MKILFVFVANISMIFFTIAQQLVPTETEALLNIFVTSMEGKPRQGEVIFVIGQKSKKEFSGITNEKGKFSLLVPEGDKYEVTYKTFGHEKKYQQIDIQKQEGMFTYQLDIKYDPPKVFTLENVYFDTGKSTLRPESYKELDELYELMRLKTSLVIEIAGHTDNVGNPQSNQILSLNRALSVKNYLVKKGINQERIHAQGYGDTQPVSDNNTEEGRQKNRRTEVRIIKE